jgi:hypothetical protein
MAPGKADSVSKRPLRRAGAICAATGAAALRSFWLFTRDRPLLRERYCLTPESFDGPDRANVAEINAGMRGG